jgi:serine/threonine-protein kinase RsbT
MMTILDEIDVADVRRQARDFAVALGFRSAASYRLATAVSELAHNLHFHAYPGGSIRLSRLAEDDRIGIEIVALDAGPGIPDLGLAMRDGYSTNRGLGAGLPGVLRLADDFAIESEAGTGTRVTATFWRP